MRRRPVQDAAAQIADRKAASILAASALIVIRYLAEPNRREKQDTSLNDDLDRIRFLANLCHNMPGIAQPPTRQPSRKNAPSSSRERAMAERPMSWDWNTAGPQGQAWIQDQLDQAGHPWTPPPPLPTAQAGPPHLTLRQRLGVLGRWPVQTPDGRIPLPRQARVLKALDTDGVCALYEEAGRLRLGLGTGGPRLRAHLAPDGTHYLVPDPADYYWPGCSDDLLAELNGDAGYEKVTALLNKYRALKR
ncbi:MAG TPA: hypothetical protein VM347_25020 [Nonomuraea sp.]|nr:hypothetical protein [Nonomuraea sp.]